MGKVLALRRSSLSSLRMHACLNAGTLELLKALEHLSELHLEHPNYIVLSILPDWAGKLGSVLRSFSLSVGAIKSCDVPFLILVPQDSNISVELLDIILSGATRIRKLAIKHCSRIKLPDLLSLVSKNLPELESLSVSLMVRPDNLSMPIKPKQ